MKPYFFVVLGLLWLFPALAEAKIKIFACEPEWAALAQEIGGDKVAIFTATSAKQDPHHMRAKPSLIAAMRHADLVICSGAELEEGWLPILLQKAGKKHPPLMAAEIVPVLEKPTKLDRAEGDIHPGGNPHVHLNPHNITQVAKGVLDRLLLADTVNAAYYQSQYDHFLQRWQEAMIRWEKQAIRLKGVSVLVHHKSFTYLLEWLGITELGTLEPKPGIPPSVGYLESLLQRLEVHSAQMIIRAPHESGEASLWLAEKTGIPAVVLPYTIGGDSESHDLFRLFDRTISLLTETL